MRLIMIRHGETEWNLQRRAQGVTDTSLTEEGIWQAKALSAALRNKRIVPDLIVSSPLQRAYLTAAEIAKTFGQDVLTDERLTEIAFGVWEGLTFTELAQQYPTEYNTWRKRPQDCRLSGAETTTNVMKRCESFLQDMHSKYENSTVLIVSHTLPLKLMIVSALRLQQEHIHNIRLDNASVSILELSP